MLRKVVIILGPTAVGKSELALEVAAAANGAIVNADSQQVYRYLDIGTGKPSLLDRQRVEHFLIDVVDPDEEFNAALFHRLASQSIEQISANHKQAIVCGGTGLYLKALTHGLFEGPGRFGEIRRNLEQRIKTEGLGALFLGLTQIDPAAAASIHPSDRQRIVRALEVYQATGKPLSGWWNEHGFRERYFDLLKIGLNRPREDLYDIINRRCERMIEDGLLDEVRGLVARGYSLELKPLRSIGYRQMSAVIEGSYNLEAALKDMQQQTRHLAKRQLTWFRRDPEIVWFAPEQKGQIIDAVKTFLRN
jgi:tRNA dimethylallyltransferase